jgi:DNA-binding HxlR family transcriptional regulator
LKLEKDPAAFLIRSDSALSVLMQLRDGRPRSPPELRRTLGNMHPQILRETVDHLSTLGLAHLRVLPGSKPTKAATGVALPVVLQITSKGQRVLDHLDHYRALVRKDRALLPASTIQRWLEA